MVESLRDNLVTTLNKTGTPSSIRYVDESRIAMASLKKSLKN